MGRLGRRRERGSPAWHCFASRANDALVGCKWEMGFSCVKVRKSPDPWGVPGVLVAASAVCPCVFYQISVCPVGRGMRKQPSAWQAGWQHSLCRGNMRVCACLCTHVCQGRGEVRWEKHSAGGPLLLRVEAKQ